MKYKNFTCVLSHVLLVTSVLSSAHGMSVDDAQDNIFVPANTNKGSVSPNIEEDLNDNDDEMLLFDEDGDIEDNNGPYRATTPEIHRVFKGINPETGALCKPEENACPREDLGVKHKIPSTNDVLDSEDDADEEDYTSDEEDNSEDEGTVLPRGQARYQSLFPHTEEDTRGICTPGEMEHYKGDRLVQELSKRNNLSLEEAVWHCFGTQLTVPTFYKIPENAPEELTECLVEKVALAGVLNRIPVRKELYGIKFSQDALANKKLLREKISGLLSGVVDVDLYVMQPTVQDVRHGKKVVTPSNPNLKNFFGYPAEESSHTRTLKNQIYQELAEKVACWKRVKSQEVIAVFLEALNTAFSLNGDQQFAAIKEKIEKKFGVDAQELDLIQQTSSENLQKKRAAYENQENERRAQKETKSLWHIFTSFVKTRFLPLFTSCFRPHK